MTPEHQRRCFKRKSNLHHGPPTKLWLSEWSIQTDHAPTSSPTSSHAPTRSHYLNAAFALTPSLPYVQGMGWSH